MIGAGEIREALLHLLFPHVCSGCGNDVLSRRSSICLRCIDNLPATDFEKFSPNPVEKKFWGRVSIERAAALFYFNNQSLVQQLMHELKYRGNKSLGLQLGQLMGRRLTGLDGFSADAIVPLPLFASRERRRGYNQATLLCRGMSEVLEIPVLDNIITRTRHTDTQTSLGRVERWQNIEGKFRLHTPAQARNRHLLLVDDVITTGATLEACAAELLQAEDCRVSIVTFASAANT